MITLIVAVSTNDVIGMAGELPWRLSDDLKHFKALTMGKPVIMGRLTWESIGRPLPGRRNIVVTRQPGFVAQGCDVAASPAAALQAAGDAEEIMIIGGAQLYELFLPKANRVYMTRVLAEVPGDAWFPKLDDRDWELVARERRAADEANEHDFEFRTYERRP